MKNLFNAKTLKDQKAVMNVKNTWKKLYGKAFVASAGVAMALTPTVAGAAAPSTYVNKVTKKGWSEISSIAPKFVIFIIAALLITYFATRDDHKKDKAKGHIYSILIGFGILLVLPTLITWFSGVVK